MRIIGLIPQVYLLVVNKCSLFIVVVFSMLSCYSVRDQQTNDAIQYDDLTKKYVYTFVEQMPNYKGGDDTFIKDFRDNFSYSFKPYEDIQTKLKVLFVIDTKGKVIGVRIYNKEKKLTDFEKAGLKALELMQNWESGKHNNKNVNVILTRTINVDFR
ncbi:hypothetical protein [Bacteroides nordii]|uniref:hypothetical protein n=1 Tax=Bacteroides nordii TaxID=291645 RepID=UPI00399A961B